MKKTSLCLAMAGLLGTGLLGAGAAQAAFLAPNSTYDVAVTGGCFAFGDCVSQGLTNVQAGSFTITTDGTGAAFSVGYHASIITIITPPTVGNLKLPRGSPGDITTVGQIIGTFLPLIT